MTYANLKIALNALSEEQLAQTVRFTTETSAGKIHYLDILDEDYASDGYECEPVSSFDEEQKAGCDFKIFYQKGTVLLCSGD